MGWAFASSEDLAKAICEFAVQQLNEKNKSRVLKLPDIYAPKIHAVVVADELRIVIGVPLQPGPRLLYKSPEGRDKR